jgi:hypothetical protein
MACALDLAWVLKRESDFIGRFNEIINRPSVYVLFDLDEQALYAGKSKTLRTRLEQHSIRQNSSATADDLLDIFDVLKVVIWYVQPRFQLISDHKVPRPALMSGLALRLPTRQPSWRLNFISRSNQCH